MGIKKNNASFKELVSAFSDQSRIVDASSVDSGSLSIDMYNISLSLDETELYLSNLIGSISIDKDIISDISIDDTDTAIISFNTGSPELEISYRRKFSDMEAEKKKYLDIVKGLDSGYVTVQTGDAEKPQFSMFFDYSSVTGDELTFNFVNDESGIGLCECSPSCTMKINEIVMTSEVGESKAKSDPVRKDCLEVVFITANGTMYTVYAPDYYVNHADTEEA